MHGCPVLYFMVVDMCILQIGPCKLLREKYHTVKVNSICFKLQLSSASTSFTCGF